MNESTTAEPDATPRRPPSRLRSLVRKLARNNRVVVVSAVITGFFVLLAIVTFFYTPTDPNAIDLGNIFAPPGTPGHPLGTDQLGRDLLSRWMVGIRYPLTGALVITVLSVTAGSAIALAMAWHGRWVDTTLGRVMDVMLGFPGLLLALMAVAVFGKGLFPAIIALSISHVPYVVRVLRSAAVRERRLAYISALRVQGFGALRIIWLHMARNVLPFIAQQATLTFAGSFVALASLSYIGLGVQPPTADWGTMLADGQTALLQNHYTEALVVGLSIIVLTAAVNVLGERLVDDEVRA